MSLDFGFYKQQGSEMLGFRKHEDLFDQLAEIFDTKTNLDNEFRVTQPVIRSILDAIEKDLVEYNLPATSLPAHGTSEFKVLLNEIPEYFFFFEPTTSLATLTCYHILFTNLLAGVSDGEYLIFRWSV